MKRFLMLMVVCLGLSVTAFGGTVPNLWLFSTDIGSDLDISDPITPVHPELQHYNGSGAFHSSWHKNKVYLSVEIWESKVYLKSDVPSEIATDLTEIATETDLGMGQDPTGTEATRKYDDDVDALDWHPIETGARPWPKDVYGFEAKWNGDPDTTATFKHRYWSADHEAAMGTDPGSIYGTLDDGEVGTGSMQNLWRVLTPAHFGLNNGVDIDAFTWITLDSDETMNLFGYNIDWDRLNPETGQWETVPMYMLAALFSVDENDPCTSPNESGGLYF